MMRHWLALCPCRPDIRNLGAGLGLGMLCCQPDAVLVAQSLHGALGCGNSLLLAPSQQG